MATKTNEEIDQLLKKIRAVGWEASLVIFNGNNLDTRTWFIDGRITERWIPSSSVVFQTNFELNNEGWFGLATTTEPDNRPELTQMHSAKVKALIELVNEFFK